MSPVREQLNEMIECLPESEQILVLEIVKRFLPGEAASQEDLADIQAARAEYQNGETVSHDAINWD